jgi:hypothetical protein
MSPRGQEKRKHNRVSPNLTLQTLDVEAVVVRAEDVNGHGEDSAWRLALFFSRMATQDREVLARYLTSLPEF